MLKDHGESVPESARHSITNPGGLYTRIDTNGNTLPQSNRRDIDDRENVLAGWPDCGRRGAKAECGFALCPAIASKHNGGDELQEGRPQTGEPCKQSEKGGVHKVSDEHYLLRSEHRRVSHHERMPCRAREKAPKLCGLFQYERPVRRDNRADIPRFVWF